MNFLFIVQVVIPSGVVGAIVSALWNHFSARSLQSSDAALKAELAALQNQFEHSQQLGQAAIDRSVFVTRAHFETEFEAMKQVFGALSEVHLAMNGLRPMMSVEPTDEPFEDKMSRLLERLQKVQSAYNKLLLESEARLPFYTVELYAAVEGCMRVASLEINSIRTGGHNSFSVDWYSHGEQNRGKFSLKPIARPLI